MNKLEAQKVVDRFLEDARIHYKDQHRKVDEALEACYNQAELWIATGAYKRKGHETIPNSTLTLQNDYACNISNARRIRDGG